MRDRFYLILDKLAAFVSSACDLMNHPRTLRRIAILLFPVTLIVLVTATTVVSAILFTVTLFDSLLTEDVRTLWNERSLREKVAAKP